MSTGCEATPESPLDPASDRRFEGTDGLERLGGEYRTADPEAFRARSVRIQLDHVALEAFGATPHRFLRGPDRAPDLRRSALSFVLVAEGRLDVDTETTAFELTEGQCILVHSGRAWSYRTDDDVRMLRTTVGVEHVPSGLHPRADEVDIDGSLDRTPLVDAFIAFISNVLRAASAGRTVAGVHTTQAVADLHAAVLAEVQETLRPGADEDDLRHRIERYIDDHLAEPDLGPVSVARAFGVSVRHIHGTYNHERHTVARVIRERRLRGVAEAVLASDERPSVEALAERFGFRDGAALQRHFRRRMGTSIAAYRNRTRAARERDTAGDDS